MTARIALIPILLAWPAAVASAGDLPDPGIGNPIPPVVIHTNQDAVEPIDLPGLHTNQDRGDRPKRRRGLAPPTPDPTPQHGPAGAPGLGIDFAPHRLLGFPDDLDAPWALPEAMEGAFLHRGARIDPGDVGLLGGGLVGLGSTSGIGSLRISAVPAPGVLPLLGLALLGGSRRRRRR